MRRILLSLILLAFLFVPDFSLAASNTLVIYSFKIGSNVNGVSNSNDEYVAIKNISNSRIDLVKYVISRKSENATIWNNLIEFKDVQIDPGQVLVVGHTKYSGTSNQLYSSSSYSISANNAISIRDPKGVVIDLVGLGDSVSYDGGALVNPEPNDIYKRKLDVDTDNNQNDFELISHVVIDPVESIDQNAKSLVISEILPNPETGIEWFELFNPTSQPVSLAGLKVCDGMGVTRCYYFKNKETLASFEYKSYSQDSTKITLNNSGDYLELVDPSEVILTDTGGNYGVTEKGLSLSLFGSEYKWTSSVTRNSMNIFTEIQAEVEQTTAAKKTAAKPKKLVAARVSSSKSPMEIATDDFPDEKMVAGAKTETENPNSVAQEGFKIDNRVLGIFLISLSILLILGYNLWLKREQIAKIYNKIRTRNN